MKKVWIIIFILLAGITAGLLVKKTFSLNKQPDSTVQICPPECFPEEKKCG